MNSSFFVLLSCTDQGVVHDHIWQFSYIRRERCCCTYSPLVMDSGKLASAQCVGHVSSLFVVINMLSAIIMSFFGIQKIVIIRLFFYGIVYVFVTMMSVSSASCVRLFVHPFGLLGLTDHSWKIACGKLRSTFRLSLNRL